MRTSKLAVVAILPAAALSVNAEVRMESPTSEFTYEAVGATPSVHFGRTITKAAKSPNAAETPKTAGAAKPAIARTTTRAENVGASTFTYDAFGATVSASEEGAGQQGSVPSDDTP
jgi:hypothetical protein